MLKSFPNTLASLPRTIIASILLIFALSHPGGSARAEGFVFECTETALDRALTNGGTIFIRCDGVINITGTKIITNAVVFDTGTSEVTISGQGEHRIFEVQSGGRLVLRKLTLSNGSVPVFDGRDATENGEDGNRGETALGGAILNSGGEVVLQDCTLENNRADGGNGGNGFSGSGCTDPGSGGRGGQGLGGAIYQVNGTLSITNCTFRNNIVTGGDGGNGGDALNCNLKFGEPGREAGNARGGAIYVERGMATVVNGTFFGQQARGGTGGNGGNGTGASGKGGDGGDGGFASGGAIHNFAGNVTLVHCTMDGSILTGGSGGTGGTGPGGDGGNGSRRTGRGNCIHGENGTMLIINTVLSSAQDTGNCGGRFSDGGNNISTDFSCSLLPISENDLDPLLGSLQDNGGPTFTILPRPGSPLIDRANQLLATAFDQRSYPRDTQPDIGAVEVHFILIHNRSATNSIVEGGEEAAVFEIAQESASDSDVVVNLTWQGTATRDLDYTESGLATAPLSVIVPAGSTNTLLSISALDDIVPENTETISLTLAKGLYDIHPTNGAASISLRDNDAIHLEAIRHAEEEGFRFQFQSVTGLTYRMEFSSNFLNWQSSTSIMVGNGNLMEWLDRRATNQVRRFYRLRTP